MVNVTLGTVLSRGTKEYVVMGILDNVIIAIMPMKFLDQVTDTKIIMFDLEYSDDTKLEYSRTIDKNIMLKFILKHIMLGTKFALGDYSFYGYSFKKLNTDINITFYKYSEIKRKPKSDIYAFITGEFVPFTTVDYTNRDRLRHLSFCLKDNLLPSQIYH